jgi:regulator of sigma E protease
VHYNLNNATLIFTFLRRLVVGQMSAKSIEGPIGIARISGEAARSGMPQLVMIMAIISLNLGIFNLLPIPILDGGMITMLLIESMLRCDLSLAVKERVLQFGFLFLILLFAYVMYNDIVKSIGPG